MRIISLAFLWILALWTFSPWGIEKILHGQTQLSLNSQVSPAPSIIIQSWATCVAPCSGMMLANISVNGVTGQYMVIPGSFSSNGTGWGQYNAAQWQSIPVTLPKGTGVTCNQVKP